MFASEPYLQLGKKNDQMYLFTEAYFADSNLSIQLKIIKA